MRSITSSRVVSSAFEFVTKMAMARYRPWFGGCAAILAAGGVYSVIAELIADREHEITIKTALGAQRLGLAREMVSDRRGRRCARGIGVRGLQRNCFMEFRREIRL